MTNEQILRVLERISVQLSVLPKAIAEAVREELLVPETTEPAPPGCQHPDDKRVDLGDGEWECTACRVRFVPEKAEATV